MHTEVAIHDFLGQKRIALVGVSRNPKDFSRYVMRELLSKHYDVVPVNQFGGKAEGRRCYTRIQEIAPLVDGALLMTSPEATDQVVRECVEAGVPRVWMHRGVGPGAVSATAAAYCREHGVSVIEGACPLMFLRQPGLPHRLHGLVLKVLHRHPAQRAH